MDPERQPGIKIGQIFLSRARFEHSPNVLDLPLETPVPEQKITLTVTTGLTEDRKAGMVSITVETAPDETAIYRYAVEMVALVEQEEGAENMAVSEYLTHAAPAALFPFLREALASLTGRGRFGPVWLKPLNLKLMTKDGTTLKTEDAG